MKHIKLFDKKDSLVQDIITNPSADYPIIALCQDVDDLSFCDTPIVKAKIDITSDEDVSNYIKSDYNIKSLTIDGELKFKKDTWVKYEQQLTQDDFQYTDDFGGTYVFSKYNIYVKLNSGCRNVYLTSNENATQFMLIRPHAYGGYSHQYISHEFVNIDEMKESLFIKQIDDYTYDLTDFYLYYDKTDDKYSADNLVGIFLADDNGNILTQNLSFECFDVNVGHDPKTHQVTKENALNTDINFGPKVSISGEIDINDYILVGFTQNGQLMFGEPLPIQYLIENGFGSLSNNTLDLDLTGLVGGSSEFSGMGCIYAIVDKSIEGESIKEITEITEFVKNCTITYYETITFFPILSVGEHELVVELLQQQYMPLFNNDLLISLDMRHINGEYINTDSMCNGSHKLQKVYLPHNLKNIGAFAFNYCYRLTSIIIPSSVTYIGEYAFRDTPFYKNLPNGDVYLGSCYYKYKGTMPSNTSIIIKDGTKSISDYAFQDCTNLTSVTIPSSVTEIGTSAFYKCSSLTSIVIPDSVTSIGDNAFQGCKFDYDKFINNGNSSGYPWGATIYQEDGLGINGTTVVDCKENVTNVTIPSSVTSIEYGAFSGCTSLTSVTIPDSVTNISNYAFSGCTNLASVTIPDSVTSIGSCVFDGCTSLSSITIPNSLTNISAYTFRNCSSLSSITCHATTAPTLSGDVFYRLPTNGKLYVPSGSDYSSWLSLLPSGWTIEYI